VPRQGKKIIHFYNTSGSLNSIVDFLNNVQKKVNFINLTVKVEGKSVKVTLFGPRDLQYLAADNLRDLADKYLIEKP